MSRPFPNTGTAWDTAQLIAVILFAIMMVFITGFIWKMVRDERGVLIMFPRAN